MTLASICQRTIEPAVPVVSIAEMRAHCQIGQGVPDFDAQLEAAALAATMTIEDTTRRALITQTWVAYVCGHWDTRDPVRLPRPRLQRVTKVEYILDDGLWYPWVPFAVFAANEPALIWLTDWPGNVATPVHEEFPSWRIEFESGYGNSPLAVPAPLRSAIKLMAAHIFEHRDTVVMGLVSEIPGGIDNLIAPYRIPWGGPHL